ncbi:hypothetical protein [Lederbergia graminis]|uniref:Uncharacterized protein n=1 Tax=Lederbergia graminis TaxID=735518 RepID=A0ABW0LCB2_9BACI
MELSKKHHHVDKIFWSIALPGFGQILNGKIIKGFLFVFLEFLINVKSNFNQIILLSFHGKIEEAINITDYQWLMFYPCLYFYAMWDAWRDAGGGKGRFSSIPFVVTAYFVTVGCIYSPIFKVFSIKLGPVWLPILSVIPGLLVGYIIKKTLERFVK